ncbi:hypothetical protein Pla144_22030 [Bythopirellula polymerisocia]|uniref:Uncharacterized protein n=1 Tax=Bythopirellula polymerisocia TaxID=2528003 RepID=A0A5C6CSA4_9BACT|nr:hypothetical protein Pla144_22030 [Bythopirellula polymerisocia]
MLAAVNPTLCQDTRNETCSQEWQEKPLGAALLAAIFGRGFALALKHCSTLAKKAGLVKRLAGCSLVVGDIKYLIELGNLEDFQYLRTNAT